MPHLLIAGHFGCGNLGDDAILLGFIHGIDRLGFDVTVMSGSPEETFRNYGIRSIPRRDSRAVSEALARTDALVFAGGSVFQDVTSVGSALVYANLVGKAKKAGKKVLMLGQGVGPLTKFLSKRAAAGAFNSADCIVVRDPESARALVALGVRQTARVGADLAFMMPPAREEGEQQFGVAGMKTVGIAPRPFGKNNKEVVVLFGDLCRMLFQTQHVPVLIEMDRNEDGPLISEIEKSQGGKVPSMKKLATPIQVQSRIARMDAVIGMRLHASILATGVGVPAMTISYDPKVAAFANILGLGSAIPIEGLTAQRLFDNYLTFEKAKDRNVKILETKRQELQQMAQVNIEVLTDVLRTTSAR